MLRTHVHIILAILAMMHTAGTIRAQKTKQQTILELLQNGVWTLATPEKEFTTTLQFLHNKVISKFEYKKELIEKYDEYYLSDNKVLSFDNTQVHHNENGKFIVTRTTQKASQDREHTIILIYEIIEITDSTLSLRLHYDDALQNEAIILFCKANN